jgi:hypothetical protein
LEAGIRFVERILSVVATLNVPQRPIFMFLVQAREAAIRRSQPRSLGPTT